MGVDILAVVAQAPEMCQLAEQDRPARRFRDAANRCSESQKHRELGPGQRLSNTLEPDIHHHARGEKKNVSLSIVDHVDEDFVDVKLDK